MKNLDDYSITEGGRFQLNDVVYSSQGQEVLIKHPDIFKIISNAVYLIRNTFMKGSLTQTYDSLQIDQNIKIELIGDGSQSKVYLLTIDEDKYIIKVKASKSKIFKDVSQKYRDELERINLIRSDVQASEIELPIVFMASEEMIVMQYIDGSEPSTDDVLSRIQSLKLIIDYIKRKQQANDPLWVGIHLDLINNLLNSIKTDNFVTRKSDNKLFMVDPFYCLQS